MMFFYLSKEWFAKIYSLKTKCYLNYRNTVRHVLCNQSINSNLEDIKASLISDLKTRVEDRILEPENLKLLSKLINQAETIQEAIEIAKLGTSYKRTGFHFDQKIEKLGDTIKYFKKNEKLSFTQKEAKNTHKLIIGDNFDALQNLLISYKNKIDVIYIDPPYGKDDMGEFADTNYYNAITRDNLLSMLYPRLVLAKQLLSDEGVIYCSIDDKNQAYLKCMMDEILGEQNFISNLIWKCRNSLYYTEPCISIQTEYILLYAKNISSFKLNSFDKTNIDADSEKTLTGFFFNRIKKKYDSDDYVNPDNDPRGPYKTSGKVRDDGRPKYTVTSPTGVQHTEAWVYSPEIFNKLDKDGQIYWGNDGSAQPRKKSYFKDFIGNVSSNLLTDEYVRIVDEQEKFVKKEKYFDIGTTEAGTKELKKIFDKNVFGYPKPVHLIKYLVQLYPKKNCYILDFFAGSGTTGQAVLELNNEDGGNRQFIVCTNNEITKFNQNGIAYDVTSKRLKRVMTGCCYDGFNDFKWIKENSPLGDNLDVYEIAEVSNSEQRSGKTPFEVIDETLYGQPRLLPEEKIEWVCKNFEHTQKYLEDTKNK